MVHLPNEDNLNPVIWPPNQNQKKVSVSEPVTTSYSKTEENFEAMARKKMSICSQEVCEISESCNKEICRLTGESYDNRPASPVPDRELGQIVKQNVVAVAQSHGGRKSKRATSQTCSKMTYTEGVCAQSLATQLMMLAPRGLSPQREDSPEVLDISSRPHGIKSLLPPACVYRSLTPTQIVIFPPQLPDMMVNRSRSSSPLPPTGRTNLKKKDQKREDPVKGTPPSFVGLPIVTPTPESAIDCKVEELESEAPTSTTILPVPVVMVTEETVASDISKSYSQNESQTEQITEMSQQVVEESEQEEICTKTSVTQKIRELETQNEAEITHKITQEKPFYDKMYTKQEVEKIVKEELKKVFLREEVPPKTESVPGPSLDDLPEPVYASGGMAMALSTASDRPFTPAPFPRAPEMSLYPNEPKPKPKERKKMEKYVPIPEPTEPYFPPPPPPPDTENKDERIARALREVQCRSPMTEALTIAPERSFSPLPTTAKVDVTKLSSVRMDSSTERTCSTKSSESSCPIKSVKAPITLSGTASAFKPTGNGNGSLIPKSTPLVYIPQVSRGVQEQRIEERYGIDKKGAAQGGKTKEMIAGFERSQNITDTSSEINEMEFSAMKSTEVQYGCAVAKNPPPQAPTVPQRSAPTGLRGEHLLPSYQQWLGDIPVRNEQVRSMSPFPHQIKAPSMEPRPMPQAPSFPHNPRTQAYYSAPRSRETQKYSSCASQAISTMSANATVQQPSQTCTLPHALAQQQLKTYSQSQASMSSKTESSSSTKTVNQNATISSTCSKTTSRSSRTVSPLAGKPASVTTSGKQTFKPDIPARALSPSWKADYVRSVQNLSPITVRLPSPVPPPLKPKGEQTQVTSANVTVKNKSKTTTASSKPPTSTQSTKTQPTPGHCGTSKGCGTPPGTPKGRGSPSGHCGTSQGCGTPEECRSPTKELGKVKFSAQQNAVHTSHKSNISNKENITTSVMQMSEKKAASQTTESYESTTSSTANENAMYDARKMVFTNRLVGILKKSANETDNKSKVLPNLNCQSKRNPLQPSSISCNTSWQPLPTNLPLPRNCGVNPSSSGPNAGGAGGLGGGRSSIAGSTAPRRGRGVLNTGPLPGGRVALCGHCNNQIRGPFITALGKIWCPEHFVCVNPKCKRPLQDIGFVEEDDGLYCEYCFEQYLAPACDKCRQKIKGDCLNAIGKHFHPECFKCSYCEKLFGNNPFFLEDGLPYCENDWNELFTTKCFSCGFPIEAGDRWVEALNNNYHSQCFNCTMCKKNLEGQSFFAKGGRPFCKNHAR
ncbi:hypothetical protein GE061_013208 [Apolygus lucorum]|uniref:LIM zinc-binding domain-containing protein n=1 Tax=Apolygus lucorum TaxID=248454 RepID=A0A8S9XUG5_APOLU|nr:hypothetical protein GE061_013208 [Apolygus lucorum]